MAIKQRTTSEEWRPVDGCPLYEVSNMGRVRSLPSTYIRHEWRHQREQTVRIGGRVVNGWIKKSRYGRPQAVLVSVMRPDGTKWEVGVHRLVLTAFVGPCPDGMEGCHYDGDPTNNRLENLRWDTHAANVADCIRHGRKTDPPHVYGEKHHNAFLTDAQVAEIRAASRQRGVAIELAKRYGTKVHVIYRIRDGQTRCIR